MHVCVHVCAYMHQCATKKRCPNSKEVKITAQQCYKIAPDTEYAKIHRNCIFGDSFQEQSKLRNSCKQLTACKKGKLE